MNNLELLKANLGISGENRDDYLKAILKSTEKELTEEKGIVKNGDVFNMFLIDYSAWHYRNRGEGILPRNLQYRLHNLIVGSAKDE